MLYLLLSRRSNPELGIRRRYEALVTVAFVILGAPLASTHLAAQWLKYPTAGVPRKADGKVDMSAPSPRMADGKPDFSGIWTTGEPNGAERRACRAPKRRQVPGNRRVPTTGRIPVTPATSRPRAKWRISVSIFREGCLINLGWCRSSRSAPTTWRKTTPTSGACRITFFARTGCRIC